MKTRMLSVLVVLFLMTGCDAKQLTPELSRKLDEANTKLATLEGQISDLKNEIDELKKQKAFDDFFRESDKYAYLTPGDEGYSAIRFDLGVLTVKLDDIKPYANGSKITLRIGNTLSAAIDGLTATLEWGKVDSAGTPINDEAKSKKVTLKEVLPPGAWTKTSLVLDGVKPSELGFVRLKGITHRGIRLFK